MRPYWIIPALLIAATPGHAQESPLDWLVGRWCGTNESGRQSCETWQPMLGEVMRGQSVTRQPGKVTVEEAMRITRKGGQLIFHAEPPGQAATDFFAPGRGAGYQSVTFTNAAHDYPQRIRYWRDGTLLMAEVSLLDGSRPQRWKFERAGD